MKWTVDLEPSVIVWPWTKQLTQTCNLINTGERGERPFPFPCQGKKGQAEPGSFKVDPGEAAALWETLSLAILYVRPTIFFSWQSQFYLLKLGFFCLALTMNYVIHTEGYKKLTYSSAPQVRGWRQKTGQTLRMEWLSLQSWKSV